MKRIILVFIGLIIVGCIFPMTRNLSGVIQSYDDFTLIGNVRVNDTTSIGKLQAGDTALFVEFGADTCYVAEYQRGNERYKVEGVSFSRQKGALGAYFISDFPGAQSVELEYYVRKGENVIQFVKGLHFVSVITSRGGNLSGAYELARILSKSIRGAAIKPDIYSVLPQFDKIEQSEYYFMGAEAFQLRFSSELSKVLHIDESQEGFAARYTVDKGEVDLLKIRYAGREQSLEIVNSYLKSRSNRPIILPRVSLQFYTIVETDRSETYIAEYSEWLLLMIGRTPSVKAKSLFEYILRSGE